MAIGIAGRLGKRWDPKSDLEETEYEVSYEGAVLDTGEINGRDDSDFYAVVYDAATDTVKRVEYATTRGWTYANYAKIDATDEVIAKAESAMGRQMAGSMKLRAKYEADMPEKGRRVKVVKGRKVPVGTEGAVVWLGEDRYDQTRRYRSPYAGMFGPDKFGKRVGLKLDDGSVVWTAATNVDVIEPEQYIDEAAIEGAALARARGRNWRWIGSLAA